jgi:hypothetical protein
MKYQIVADESVDFRIVIQWRQIGLSVYAIVEQRPISRYDFDCFTDIKWDSASELDIKVSESCYHAFKEYLVKNGPAIKYKVQANDTIKGNIQPYMQ